ncbi:hypothetical protein BN2475_400022 [Paraburkholderia ribeironis]|uniref:Uncharacterized protein n=1 Tax=Paraburkholderia ribeironis TaxID=1247936 RepID=A0A1N7S6I1_9BURK|nr:hypothetical protein BN2475_400022 [Paraburkholderia ribeironis]
MRTVPSSRNAKPACIASTIAAPSKRNRVSVPVFKLSIDLSRLCQKAGIERKKWAKVVPDGVESVQCRTAMGFAHCAAVWIGARPCTVKCMKSTIKVHARSISSRMTQIRAKYSILITTAFGMLTGWRAPAGSLRIDAASLLVGAAPSLSSRANAYIMCRPLHDPPATEPMGTHETDH